MAQDVPNKLYRHYVNGQPYYEVGAWPSAPWSYSEIPLSEAPPEMQQQLSQQLGKDSPYVSNYTNPLTGENMSFVSKTSVAQMEQAKADLAAGKIRETAPGSGLYVPTGSAADLNLQGKSYDQQLATPSVQQQIKDQNLQPVNPNPTSTPPATTSSNQSAAPGTTGAVGSGGIVNPDRANGGIDYTPNTPGTAGTTGGGIASTLPTTGNPQLDATLQHLDEMIQTQIANGQKVNPNIEITPEQVQKFIDQASSEVAPYYQNIIRSVKDDLTKNLQYMQKQYDLKKQADEANFKSQLGTQRESAANAGLTFSGQRNLGEQQTVDSQNRNLQDSALTAAKASQDAIRTTEQKIGSRNLSDLQIPGMSEYTASLDNNGSFNPGRSLDFGTLGGVTGSTEYAQAGDTRQLSDFYKQQEVEKRSLNFSG